MNLPTIPGKAYAVASLAVYLFGMYQSRKQAVSALVAYAVSALLLFLTMTPEERESKHQRNQMWLMAAVFYIPALIIFFAGNHNS
jgi:multisubunit Na+/H+ antiporter MnhB subunit